jgi:DNA-binding transcriptional ArsR family regulator
MTSWSFLSNHGRALLCIARDPEIRLRDIAANLGITERRAYDIVNDLTDAGYVLKEKEGRRNRYQVQDHLPIPEDLVQEQAIGDVLALLTGSKSKRTGSVS